MKVSKIIKLALGALLAATLTVGCGPKKEMTALEKIKEEFTKANPFLIPSEYEMGLAGRKPVYVPYAQAVPNTPAIDRDVCIHFKTGGCKVCADICQMDAIDHTMKDETVEIEAGAVVLSPGFEPFDPCGVFDFSGERSARVVVCLWYCY